MASEELLLKIGVESDMRSLSSINKEFKNLEKGVKTLNSQFKNSTGTLSDYQNKSQMLTRQIELQTEKMNRLKTRISDTQTKMASYKKQIDELKNSEGDHGKEIDALEKKYQTAAGELNNYELEMKSLSNQVKDTTSELNKCNSEMANLSKLKLSENLTAQGKKIQDLGDKWQKAGGIISSTGTKIVSAFAPIESAGALAVKCAIDFESSWASATKTIDGTDEQLQRLQDGLRGLAMEMPTNINDLNELAAAAGQMGIGVDDITEYVRVMAMLGETTNISANEATTALAQLLNITDGNVEEISNLGSAIVDLGNHFATDEATIVEFAQRIAGVGASANISEQDILGFSAAMGALGINVEAGGTSFSTFVSKIQMACSEGGESLEKFAQVAGMSGEEFKNAFNENATEAIKKVIKGMHDYQEQGGDLISLIGDLGISETRQRDLLLRLAQGYDIVEKAIDTSNRAWQENTALQDEASKRYETTASQMAILKNKLYDVGISIGAQLLPVINDMIDKVGEAVEWFSKLPPELSANIIKFATIATSIGLVTTVTGKMVTGIGGGIKTVGKFVSWIGKIAKPATTATTAIQAVTTATSGISTASASTGVLSSIASALGGLSSVALPVAGALAAVGAGIVAFKTNWAGFRDTCESVTEDIGRIFNVWKERMLKVFGHIKEGWEDDFLNIRTMLTTGWENITTIFEVVFDTIANLFDAFADGFEGDWEGVWENIFEITDNLFDGFTKAWSNSLDTILVVLDDMFPGIKEELDFLPKLFEDGFGTIGDIVGWGVNNVKLTFEALNDIFHGDFKGAWDLFVDNWAGVWEKVKDILLDAKDWIVEKFNDVVDSVTDFAINFKEGVIEKYEEVKEGIVTKVSEMKEAAVNKVEELKEDITEKWEEVKESVTTKVQEMVEAVVTFFSELPYNIAYILGEVVGYIATWCVDIYNYLATNVPMWIDSVGNWFSELPGRIVTWLNDTLTKISNWGSDTYNYLATNVPVWINSVGNWFKELPTKIKTWLDDSLNKARIWGTQMGAKATEAATQFITKCINVLKELPGKVKAKLDEAVEKVKSWGSQSASSAASSAKQVVNAVDDGLKSLPQIALKWGLSIPSKIWDGISSGLSSLKSKVSSMLSGLVNSAVEGFKSTFNPGSREHGGEIKIPEVSYTNEPYGGKSGFELIDGPAKVLSKPTSRGTLTLLGTGASVKSNLASTALMMSAVRDEVSKQLADVYLDYGNRNSASSQLAFNFANPQQIFNNTSQYDDSDFKALFMKMMSMLIDKDTNTNVYLNPKSMAKTLTPYIDKELDVRSKRDNRNFLVTLF